MTLLKSQKIPMPVPVKIPGRQNLGLGNSASSTLKTENLREKLQSPQDKKTILAMASCSHPACPKEKVKGQKGTIIN